jgi:hypothetical protein
VTETRANDGQSEGSTGTTFGDVKEVIRESQRLAGLRIAAMSQGGFSAAEQAEYGTTADGAPAEGGLTPAGIEFADAARHGVNDFVREHLGRHHQEHPPARKPAAASPLDTLGLTGPFRAALRAGAQALAAALDDGASDGGVSEGVQVDEDGNEFTMVKLGPEPFVLLRVHDVGEDVGQLELAAGGVTYDHDRREGVPAIGDLLRLALEMAGADAREGAEYNKARVVDRTEGGAPDGVTERAADTIRRIFGEDVGVEVIRRPRPRAGGSTAEASEAEQRLLDAMFGEDGPQASGAGPSTEAPSMPHWGSEPEPFDTPREGDAGAPGGPVRDDDGAPTSTPRPLDDVGAPSDSTSTSSSSGGGTDSAGSTGGGSE